MQLVALFGAVYDGVAASGMCATGLKDALCVQERAAVMEGRRMLRDVGAGLVWVVVPPGQG